MKIICQFQVYLVIIIILLIFFSNALSISGIAQVQQNSQLNGYDWSKTIGGKYLDAGNDVQQTYDGGYIIAGVTFSFNRGENNSGNGWLIKTDICGTEVWNQTFYWNETAPWGSEFYSVQQTSDSGYIVAGTISFNYEVGWFDHDLWLIKTDINGNMEWNKTFNGAEHSYDDGWSVCQTFDGGYIVAGRQSSKAWMIKTDSCGNYEWNKTFGEQESNIFLSVQQTTDGGYIAGGYTGVKGLPGDYDFWLVKVTGGGVEEWNRTYGGRVCRRAWSVQPTDDGGYILAGIIEHKLNVIEQVLPSHEILVIKTDNSGNVEWKKKYGYLSTYERCREIKQTPDGGFILVGYIDHPRDPYNNYNVFILKIDNNGNIVWDRQIGGMGDDWGYAIEPTADDGCIVAGRTQSYGAGGSDVWLIKVSPFYIAKPKAGHIYVADRKIMPTHLPTVVLGKITVMVDSSYDIALFNQVEFYVDNVLKCTDNNAPFEWVWDETVFGKHTLKAIAYDEIGKIACHETTIFIVNV